MRFFLLLFIVIFSVNAQAKVLYQDPTGKELNADIAKLSGKNISDIDPIKKDFFLGLFYVKGAPEFNIAKDCKKSIFFLHEAWESDVADAGYTLATMYYGGICTKKNFEKSRGLANSAAQEGYILAQRMLGMAYLGEKWKGLYSQNISKGIYWLSEAGNAGDRESAAHLARIYYEGNSVSKDEKKYFEWLNKAVFSKYDKRNRLGFIALAKCYENGRGTNINLVKAYTYYDLSGTAGVDGKQRVAKEMTQDQIDEAIRQSQAWQKENNVEVGGGFIRRAN